MTAARRSAGVRWLAAIVGTAAGLMLAVAACAGGSDARVLPACGTKARQPPPAHVAHVVWIWFENQAPDDVVQSGHAPYFTSIAKSCGTATNYSAVAHPSLPNYIAATSGSTQGITDDDNPPDHPLNVPSLFGQAGGRSYAQSMPAPCTLQDNGTFAVRHVPQVYYVPLRSRCRQDVLPLKQFNAQRLTPFTFVTPDMCSDMHNCDVSQGDSWLHGFLPLILDSRDYRAGRTVVFITFDESDKDASSNQVTTLVLSEWTPVGRRSSARFNHYSLLRTTEELLGVPLLGHARGATDMLGAFHL